jgi:hypothetical protein
MHASARPRGLKASGPLDVEDLHATQPGMTESDCVDITLKASDVVASSGNLDPEVCRDLDVAESN